MIRTTMLLSTLLIFAFSAFPAPAQGSDLCQSWGEARLAGNFQNKLLIEASGLVISRTYPQRMYHINDSGDGSYLFVTDLAGNHSDKLHLPGFTPKDQEDLAVGPCHDQGTCIFFGDIGDNRKQRRHVRIVVLREEDIAQRQVKIVKNLKIRYPDRQHNAEALAVHPNGDVFILTKEGDSKAKKAYPAQLFQIKKKDWINASRREVIFPRKVGEIDISLLDPKTDYYGKLPTAMDIHPDGSRLLLLSYNQAYEFAIDLSKKKLKPTRELIVGKDYQSIPVKRLPQQEAISYLPEGDSFMYDTERKSLGHSTAIMRVNCMDKKE